MASAATVKKIRLSDVKKGHPLYEIIVAVNQLVDAFNNHTHKTPTANPGITSQPISDAAGAGSTGGTAYPSPNKIASTRGKDPRGTTVSP